MQAVESLAAGLKSQHAATVIKSRVQGSATHRANPWKRLFGGSTDGAQQGYRVKVHFTGTFDDGTVFDSSEGRDPMAFTLGSGQTIAGFERSILGMQIGESKEIRLAPKDAYGEHDERGVQKVPLDKLPAGVELGTVLEFSWGGRGLVVQMDEEVATLDLNHPLAGKALNFKITLVECKPAPKVEVETISPGDGQTYPKKGDTLTMHYTGKLAKTGEKFDSSVDRGEPFTFQIGVGQVIPGWDEGVVKMSVGEKAMLHIPAEMAYGASGAGGVIPPNADLVFEVELLKVDKR